MSYSLMGNSNSEIPSTSLPLVPFFHVRCHWLMPMTVFACVCLEAVWHPALWLSFPLMPNISLSSLSFPAVSQAHAVFSFWPQGCVLLFFQPVPRALSLCVSCHLCLLSQVYLSFGSPTWTLSVLSALTENAHYRFLHLQISTSQAFQGQPIFS